MSGLEHDDIMELLGAYALDAVDADEATEIDAHLRRCERCASEVAAHREVAGVLANSGGDAPEHVWDAIAARLDAPKQQPTPPPLVQLLRRAGADERATPLARARRSPARVWLGAAVAAAVVLIAGLGVQIVRLDHQVGQLQEASGQQAVSQGAATALADPAARHVELTAARTNREMVAEIVVLPSGSAYLVNQALPALGAGQTYQLWGEVGGSLVSLGLLGNTPRAVAFHVDPGADFTAFAVTAEHAGGVVRTTHVPVALSTTA